MTKQQLIEDNMNLVYALIAKEYPTYLRDEDIIQCGMLGLCKAAGKFDESKSQFATFAWLCIRNEIRSEFRSRAKHKGVLSLDYEVTDEDGGQSTFGDCLVGDEDVVYIDVNTEQLTPREKQVFDLYQISRNCAEVGRQLGVSRQYVWGTMRKVRALNE